MKRISGVQPPHDSFSRSKQRRRMKASWLLIPLGLRGLAALSAAPTVPRGYEVQLAYTGYTGLAESVDCNAIVNLTGYDSLDGPSKASRTCGASNPSRSRDP